eukprot:CAMPEP_0183734490 /NCGR_PEP_ID=MMETSP0737-20130205/43938_1 /TAXON_ID=385413 /ORGANISM="Thalassiosira miniscula, Strain CCMP1093" /LENGTH=364 /DNA_ID=CAMNT_0025967987 /DNA_START=94 /DNA_END=1188 /DNA_ORIENTATION=-
MAPSNCINNSFTTQCCEYIQTNNEIGDSSRSSSSSDKVTILEPKKGVLRNKKTRGRKAVQFSQTVNVRGFILDDHDCGPPPQPRQHQEECDDDAPAPATATTSSALWLTKDEIDATKRCAKILSKLHCQRRMRMKMQEQQDEEEEDRMDKMQILQIQGSTSSESSSDDDDNSPNETSSHSANISASKSRSASCCSSSPPPPFNITNNNNNNNCTKFESSLAHATHYTIQGESLRGLEMYTDAQRTHRRQLRDEAILSVVTWQEERFNHYLNTSGCCLLEMEEEGCCRKDDNDNDDVVHDDDIDDSDDEHEIDELVARITAMVILDVTTLARLYRNKTRGALANAKRVADEDAKMANQILKEDLL